MSWRAIRATCQVLSTAALLVLATCAIIFLPGWSRIGGAVPAAGDFNRTDFVTIVLAAAAVILTAVGLVVALVGAIGYATIRGAAERAAVDAAEAKAEAVASRRAEQVAAERADAVAAKVADEVATRVARGVSGTLNQGGTLSGGDAFAEAEGREP